MKPRPSNIDDWTHYLHNASNNAVARDARVAPPTSLQWDAGPRWGRSHEYNTSLSGMVTAGGRIFTIVDEPLSGMTEGGVPTKWTLLCMDAFNGLTLWKRPMDSCGEAARLRRQEGDDDGAEWIEYQACKTGAGMLAALFLPDWLRNNKLQWGDIEWREDTMGFKGAYPHARIAFIEPIIRNPYWMPVVYLGRQKKSCGLITNGPSKRVRKTSPAKTTFRPTPCTSSNPTFSCGFGPWIRIPTRWKACIRHRLFSRSNCFCAPVMH